MKKIFFLSFFAVLLITACEKPTPPNGDSTDPIDTTSLSYYLGGEWESIVLLGNSDFLDTAIITLTFYPSEYKFYQTVQLDSNVNPDTRPYSDIIFRGDFLRDYDLREDTLYLRASDGIIHYNDHSYLIHKRDQNTMVMSYRGTLQAVKIRSYKFNRKK